MFGHPNNPSDIEILKQVLRREWENTTVNTDEVVDFLVQRGWHFTPPKPEKKVT